MTHINVKLLFVVIYGLNLTIIKCVKNTSENIGNFMTPMIMGGLSALTYNGQGYQGQMPHIAVKIMPSKKLRLTPTEMNTLLFAIKREIHNKVNKLEEELYEHRHDNEKHLSTWALNQAPVYMPFHESVKKKTHNYQKTLNLEVKKLKSKFEQEKSENKETNTQKQQAHHNKSENK
ncbi:uncharacterized protein TA08185 [Theileria annulata]|uniref:Uncharacterized protein n=1 Tax=Theileria annulata TaxID=5874 RepID=Q4U9S3_THEAN|nr:uncharacterized protein TA08185 [Theileria annulata]CAI76430.1 hypothetical protein TA08185 [Theileria annulata]|eukprot:XP_953055.1 hypothetical protein TA08185 [Theileria annulata]